MIKKISYVCMSVVILAGVLGVFSGCNPFRSNYLNDPRRDRRNPVIETDYFVVQLRQADGHAIVLELTELGKQQEVLAIPSHIRDLPVRQIGFDSLNMWGGYFFYISSENLRKIYIPYTVTRIMTPIVDPYGYGTGYGRGEDFETVFMMLSYPLGMGLGGGSGIHIALFYVLPNIIFFYNYENAHNSNIFWIDRITGYNLYLPPPRQETVMCLMVGF